MSEWLTTGEMIDRLKVGEVAEVCNDDNGWLEGNKLVNNGTFLKWVKGGETLSINETTSKLKWHILPKPIQYVTFEEAKKALSEGKPINCYWNGYKHTYSKNDACCFICEIEGHGTQDDNRATWEEIFYGKWQIIE